MACKFEHKGKTYSNKNELGKFLLKGESKEVAAKLLPLLHASGIKVEAIHNYEKITGTKVDENINGLADAANMIIAVNENKLDESTLPEEVAHLVLPNYEGSRDYERALALVENTPEYTENYSVYMQKYKNERLVRLEVLGKILSTHIIKGIKRASDNRLTTVLRRMWKSFKSLFKSGTELSDFLSTVATDILVADKINVRKDIPVMYQIDDKYTNLIERIIKSLELRMKSFKRAGLPNADLDAVINQLASAKNLQGIQIFLKHMAKSSEKALSRVRDAKEGKYAIDAKFLQDVGDYISYYEPYAHELRQIMLFDAKELPYKKKDIKEFKKTIRNSLNALGEIKDFRDVMREQETQDFLDTFTAKEFGLDKNDPEFYDKVVSKTGYDYRKQLKETHQNSNFMEFWFGAARDASDEIIRMVHAIVKRVKDTVFTETLDFGKELLNKAKELGLDHKSMEWAFETTKDEKGNELFTGSFISPTKQHEFRLAETLMRKEALKAAGATDVKEIAQWREAGTNTDALKAYNKTLAKWYNANTKNHPRALEIATQMRVDYESGKISTPAYVAWRNTNIGIGQSGVEYYKGALSIPNEKWVNKKYNTLTSNQLEFLEYVKSKKMEVDNMLPNINDNNLAPQIQEGLIDILHRKNGNLFKQLGQNIKDSVITKEEDDAYFGEQAVKRPDGSVQKYVPVYYTKLLGGSNISTEERLVETNKISTDLISSMVAYKQMQSNYTNMSKVAPNLDLLQEQVGNRRTLNKKGEEIEDSKNFSFKVIEKFLEMNVYGMTKKRLEKNILGHKVNLTKIIDTFAAYVRNNNLAWNFFTSFSNAVQGGVASKVEDLIGLHTNNASKMFATKVFLKHLPKILNETPNTIKTDKVSLLMERFKLGTNLYSAFDNLDKSKLTKRAVDSGLYWSYELTDFFLKGKLMVAMLHNHRQLPDGSYVTKNEYKGDAWDSLPNMWEQIEAKDGKLVFDEKMLRKMALKIEYVATTLDGSLSPEDYAAAHQGAISQLVTIHRSWLFSGIQRRFKKQGFNWSLGMKEEGYYVTTFDYLKSNLLNKNKLDKWKQWSLRWEELTPVEKAAVKKAAWEQAFTLTMVVLAKIINGLADDDDEYDLAAYLSNRVVLEVGAFSVTPPLMISEMTNTLRDPLVPMRQAEMMMDVGDILFGSEEVQTGQWKGYTKREKALLRLIPIVKPNILWNDPGAVNQILKARPLKWIYALLPLLMCI